jgi:poly(hydroxyalkanoate) depolymerase family esterase
MNTDLATALGRALAETRASNPLQATRLIQAALAGRPEPSPLAGAWPGASIVEDAEIIDDDPRPAPTKPSTTRRPRSLRSVIDALNRGRPELPLANLPGARPAAMPHVPEGARYERRRFACAAGARDFRLFVPAGADAPRGLVLMLHGCTQTADDFACGTRMNELADRHGLIVAYPDQSRADNPHGCWNWFRPGDQRPGAGEPQILAELAQALTREFDVDPARVFAAGLSAGGAMAATLGATHPEVFSAVGVHSGLPHGSAHDVVSAFAAMRGEAAGPTRAAPGTRSIVFHGTADATVHPSNAERVAAADAALRTERQAGRSPGGRGYTRTVATDAGGAVVSELWLIAGAGHAWSGGAAEGSYTDPLGPDASAEMLRFFLAGEGR